MKEAEVADFKKKADDKVKATAKKAAHEKKRKARNPHTGLIHHKDGSREFFPEGTKVGGANHWVAKDGTVEEKEVEDYQTDGQEIK